MKVLIVDNDYTRGGAERIVWGVEEFTPHHARGLFPTGDPSRYAGSMPLPRAWSLDDPDEVDEAIRWCDVIHCMHAASPRKFGRPNVIGVKPIVWMMHTQWDIASRQPTPRWYADSWLEGDEKYVRRALVAEGWQRYDLWNGKRFVLLPAVFPITLKEFLPIPVEERERKISFAVMYKGNKPPAPKGYRETLALTNGLPRDVMHKVPFVECMRRKARSWIGIDEIVTDVVHFSCFEYLSLGVPCISKFDKLTHDTICAVTGAKTFPVLSPEDPARALVFYLDEKLDWLRYFSQNIRSWMETYMHPKDVIKKYVALWESL